NIYYSFFQKGTVSPPNIEITSTSETFIKKVEPQFAILSYGSSNPYGHPHQSVVKRLKRHGIMVYRTNKSTVEMETDGEHIMLESSGLMPLLK
ncbi:hypothetical protein ACUOA5_46210, partial [Escherichia coli]